VGLETLEFMMREMQSVGGSFGASYDADSDGLLHLRSKNFTSKNYKVARLGDGSAMGKDDMRAAREASPITIISAMFDA